MATKNDYRLVFSAVLDSSMLKRQVDGLINKNGDLKQSYTKINKEIKTTGKTIKSTNDRFNHNANDMGKGLKGMIGQWGSITKKVIAFGAATAVIGVARNAIGAMVTEVKTLDKSLVELQKVTDLQGQSLKDFTDDAFEAGKTVARTGSEMVDAATEFAKAGFDPDQALELGRIASRYLLDYVETYKKNRVNCWKPLKTYELQHKDEICLSVNV